MLLLFLFLSAAVIALEMSLEDNCIPIINASVIAMEEQCKGETENLAVAPTLEQHADRLHGFSTHVDFLLYLTLELGLWAWKTREMMQFVIKPATEGHGHCRFAELPVVRSLFGPAAVLKSCCCGDKWDVCGVI